MRAIQPYDLVITVENLLALVVDIRGTNASLLVGNGLSMDKPLAELEAVEFTYGCDSPASFAEAFRGPLASRIQRVTFHRP